MKKSHIIGIILIAFAIGAVFTSLGNASTYASFSIAEKDPNLFTFYIKDSDSAERKVVLRQAKPLVFEHTEQIVTIGKCVVAVK